MTTSETRFATNRGQRIAYDVAGNGPAVVLQHGLFGSRRSWRDTGFVEALADGYRVICIDSLGHGSSDKPAEAAFYGLKQRAGDVAAVLDAEGVDRAHFIGYSMGGWVGAGMLQYQPRRLLSMTIGGRDPDMDMSSLPGGGGLDFFLDTAAPERTAWVTEDVKPGLRACVEALSETEGAREAIANASIPLLFWIGEADPQYRAVRQLAGEVPAAELLEVPGNHGDAYVAHAQESIAGLLAFLDRAEQRDKGG